ncbi:DUF2797 domain-containing protein [bacterium]|nr:DUF2797 domain-containing protein [bacterium]MBU1917153.1 DUF2797 domain-containing protein [bacterium]
MHTGILRKMAVQRHDDITPVDYYLPLGDHNILLNDYLNTNITLTFSGDIHCINCDCITYKSFSQGHCYPCFTTLASCDMCMMKPETCHHHKGTCRDNYFATDYCFNPHIVYLAVSSNLKVGITRETQKLIRWIDQGASYALVFAVVPDRKTAGDVEIEVAKHIADRTNWRRMLSNNMPEIDLVEEKHILAQKLPKHLVPHLSDDNTVTRIIYPAPTFPEKIKSLNFDKTPKISRTLRGIKGQYLIFDDAVINLRKFQGYEIGFAC